MVSDSATRETSTNFLNCPFMFALYLFQQRFELVLQLLVIRRWAGRLATDQMNAFHFGERPSSPRFGPFLTRLTNIVFWHVHAVPAWARNGLPSTTVTTMTRMDLMKVFLQVLAKLGKVTEL
mmetsp:Transcript_35420/g.42651  ORF Transcript_35420/g.42651 Transcript_35420/m.42651 type:complete len:122 (+) Transcript_35420:26-391(+)